MSHYYPIFLDLRGKQCLVVGAGEVASGKILPLLEAGALVRVVAPWLHPRMQDLLDHPGLTLQRREFQPDDLDGAWLVIAATDQPTVNHSIYTACEQRRIFVNVADDTPNCSFILPSIATEGPLKVAISTSGTSPSLAGSLRRRIQTDILTPELAAFAAYLGSWRAAINPLLPTFAMKKDFWHQVVRSRIRTLVANGRHGEAASLLQTILDSVRAAAELPQVWLDLQGSPGDSSNSFETLQARRTA